MRPILLAVVLVTVLILAVPAAAPRATLPSPPAPLAGLPTAAPVSLAPGAVPSAPAPRVWDLNTTLSPKLLATGSTGPTPISAISPVPLPPIPSTTPTVMTFLTASKDCCVSANYTAPSGGPWALIVLNYTGEAVAGVYDSSFRAYIDQAQVFFGTTPEYGIWYDDADVTPYASLLTGTFNFTFLLGAAVTSGYFLTSVSLSFYPVPAGGSAPTEPNMVLPLWHRVFANATSTSVSTVASVPDNVTNATLQLWAYGFGPDEFWYAQQPALRTIEVRVDNSTVLDDQPFQYINTGGNDLFAWRPITGAFTLSDRPYDLDVTGLLGTLEGTHYFTATITDVTSGSSWLLGGSLLLTTSPGAPSVTAHSSTFTASAPHVSEGAHSYAEFTNYSFSAVSTFGSGAAPLTVAVFTNSSYQGVILTSSETVLGATTQWENISALETMDQTVLTSGDGPTRVVTTNWSFPLSIDLGSLFVPFPGQGSGYPIYGNVTTYMLDLQQEWNETSAGWYAGGPPEAAPPSYTVDYRVTGGNNLFTGEEELISANGAELLSISFVQSATTAEYRATTTSGGLTWSYDHLLVGSGYNPPPPNEVQTVLVNALVDPVAATLSASPPTVDVGQGVELMGRVVGGTGTYSLAYLGLPPGCASSNATNLLCWPTVAGQYTVWLDASDSDGASSPAASLTLTVLPAPTLVVAGNGGQVDAGVTASFGAEVTGGLAPYNCVWTLPGTPVQTTPCGVPFNTTGTTAGTMEIGSVEVEDATGTSVNATFSFTVVDPPTVAWIGTVPTKVAAPSAVDVRASASDGVAPYTYVWLVNGTAVQSSTDANFTLVVAGSGTFTLVVEVTDADGVQAVEGPVSVVATASASPSPGTGTSSGSGSSNALEWALLAGAAAGVVGLLVGILVGRASAPRRPRA